MMAHFGYSRMQSCGQHRPIRLHRKAGNLSLYWVQASECMFSYIEAKINRIKLFNGTKPKDPY